MHIEAAQPETVAPESEPEPGDARGRSWYPGKNTCGLVFAALSLLFGCSFALITPPLWGLDEATHFARVYAVDHGQILPKEIPHESSVNYGGDVPSTFVDLLSYSFTDFKNAPSFPDKSVVDPQGYADRAAQPLRAPLEEVGFANTSSYSPVSYVPSVLGLRAVEIADGSVGAAITLMRLCDVLAFTGIVWLALRALREHRFKWVVFVVALLPMTVFEAGVITADAVTNGLAILFSALLVKSVFFRERLPGFETGLLFASAFLLPLAKPTYVLLALLLPLVPSARMAVSRWVSSLVTVAGVVGFGIWTALSAQTSAAMHLMRPGETVDPGLQVQYLLTHLTEIPRILVGTFVSQENRIVTEMFGTFGNTQVQAPSTAAVGCVVAGVLAIGLSERLRPTRAQLAVTASVALISIAAIFGTLYLEFTIVGHMFIEGVQGRYFIPLIVVSIAVLARLVPLRLELPSARVVRGTEVAIVALMFFALATSALKYDFLL